MLFQPLQSLLQCRFCSFSWGNQKNINMFTLSSLHVQTHWKLALCLFGSVGLSLAALQYKTKLSQLRAATNVTAHGWKPALVLANAKPKSCNNKNRHYLKSTGFIWVQLHTSNTGNVSKHRDFFFFLNVWLKHLYWKKRWGERQDWTGKIS